MTYVMHDGLLWRSEDSQRWERYAGDGRWVDGDAPQRLEVVDEEKANAYQRDFDLVLDGDSLMTG